MTQSKPSHEYNASIIECTVLHDELRIIRIKPDGVALDFTPGQYVEIGLFVGDDSKLVRRQYSIASSPGDPRGIELYIVRVDKGALTEPLWDQQLGSRLWLNPKAKGKFTIDEIPVEKNFFLIATGTGLAPFISMLRTYEHSARWREAIVVHGVRIARDLGYDAELRNWSERSPSNFYLPCVSREPDFPGLQGRIPDCFADGRIEAAIGRKLSAESDQVLICGNPAMIDDVVKVLESRGFSLHKKKTPGNIHFERYW